MEKRITRGKGINPNDKRIYKKVIEWISLDDDHDVQEEVFAYLRFYFYYLS